MNNQRLKDIEEEAYKRFVGQVIDPLRPAPKTAASHLSTELKWRL
jgi:hypothetical protein